MFAENWKKEVFTIPNLLSLLRILLIPVYMFIYLHAQRPLDYLLSGAILALSCLTDLADGKIARKYHMTSSVGKILDPIADKATQITLTACLSLRHPVLFPMLILLAIKEVFQLSAGLLALMHGKMLPGALLEGKISTAVLFISLILLLLFPNPSEAFVAIAAAVDSVFLLTAFVAYFLAYCGRSPKVQDIHKE